MRIADYALLGDCHSSALVGRDGSIDWACFPRFDSPAVFCRLLDQKSGGSFSISLERGTGARRAYVPDTNVLVTRLTSTTGALELTDCMPVRIAPNGSIHARHSLLRRLRCVEGEVLARVVVAPRFEYGAFTPRVRLTSSRTAEVVGGRDALWVTGTRPLVASPGAVRVPWVLRAGEEAWIEAAWSSSLFERDPSRAPDADELARRLAATLAFWRAWMEHCRYHGPHAEAVRRSALVLKALTYAPSGAVVAAPTTSLPEDPGGERNWDYRYTWIRDTSLTLISLLVLGFRKEADAFRHWLRRTSAGRPEDLQILYGIRGDRLLPEVELPHLAGHQGSRPVRIGNGAVRQLQLDVYGEMLEAVWLYAKVGGHITATNWSFVSGLADAVAAHWHEPDQGLWEVRSQPRQFLHSKLLCWVALDRAVRTAKARRLPGPVGRWAESRDRVRAFLLDAATELGWFSQAAGLPHADASMLLVPAFGFLPPAHPLVRSTIAEVDHQLTRDGLLLRYVTADGVRGGEGTFLLCSFWLADALLHAGERARAEELISHLIDLANDVGLWAEELDPVTGAALGNFPQAFPHMALVSSCAQLAATGGRELPSPFAYDFSETALDYARFESTARGGQRGLVELQ